MVVCCDNGVSNRYCYMVGCGVDAIRPAGLGLVGYCLDMRTKKGYYRESKLLSPFCCSTSLICCFNQESSVGYC